MALHILNFKALSYHYNSCNYCTLFLCLHTAHVTGIFLVNSSANPLYIVHLFSLKNKHKFRNALSAKVLQVMQLQD